MREKFRHRCGVAVAFLASCAGPCVALPPGFSDTIVSSDWDQAVGVAFAPAGSRHSQPRMFVWEKGGRVWIVENDVKSAAPVIDLSDEVGNWNDHGLLGFAPDPDYAVNGRIYLMYVVDHYHLTHAGLPDYDPAASEPNIDTIGRIVRYTCRASDGFRTADPSTRTVLLGETAQTGTPVCSPSHGVGSLVFGDDGTLLASIGDGAWFSGVDAGGPTAGSSNTARAEGIIRPDEDVGAFRAQILDSLSGKILRLDPETGDGVPSNPYYEPGAPRSAKSRVYAMGFRNPYRMTIRPGSGSEDPADGRPGVLYIGDVGWGTWEELDICTVPGQNMGWPLFEGLTPSAPYQGASPMNADAPNPLGGGPGCPDQFFRFRDLIIQDTPSGDPRFPNPCSADETIPAEVPHWVHRRPAIDWMHADVGPSRTGIFGPSGEALAVNLTDPQSPISGGVFGGRASVGGVWYTGDDFPAEYRGTYFHADFQFGWIRSIRTDGADRPVAVQEFLPQGLSNFIVCLASDPVRGGLYYIDYNVYAASFLHRVSYAGANNQPPVAHIDASARYGASPMHVTLDGRESWDPEGKPLSYLWSFGDGSVGATTPVTEHTFTFAAGPKCARVKLTVTDPLGMSDTASIDIAINNTPPSVGVESPADGGTYSVRRPTEVTLLADISDAEEPSSHIVTTWQVILHHADHTHPEEPTVGAEGTATLLPVGCDGETYFYELRVVAQDSYCLETARSVYLFPACCPPDVNGDGFLSGDDFDQYVGWFELGDERSDYDADGFVSGDDFDAFGADFSAGC